MNKRILISLSIIGVVAAIAIGATTAYFSDVEESKGNTFTAGSIDLKVDNESWYNGVYQERLSWEPKDLENELFFDFDDLKPGDWGEDTISIEVENNDSWLCAEVTLTSNDENDITEPEEEMGDTAEKGELADELYFIWWADDGDNVLEDNEQIIGGIYKLGDAWLNQGHTIAISDSETDILEIGALKGGKTYHFGKAWCYGTLKPTYDGQDNPGVKPGFTCNGEPVSNISQSDSATLDVKFIAVQARNNENFVCGGDYYGRERTLRLENKDSQWQPILGDGIFGWLTFKSPYPTFDFDLYAQGLNDNEEYCLIYYADPWPGDGVEHNTGALIWNGNARGGVINVSGSKDINTDIPNIKDTNYPDGGKIWLVPCSDYDKNEEKMIKWHPTEYLMEWNLIKYDDTDL